VLADASAVDLGKTRFANFRFDPYGCSSQRSAAFTHRNFLLNSGIFLELLRIAINPFRAKHASKQILLTR
jgi:hypothetical protein